MAMLSLNRGDRIRLVNFNPEVRRNVYSSLFINVYSSLFINVYSSLFINV